MAPAYDLVSTAIYPLSNKMSFAVDGKYDLGDIRRSSFENEASKLGLGKKAAMSAYDALSDGLEKALREAAYDLKECGLSDAASLCDKILLRDS